jgi:plastocyanin
MALSSPGIAGETIRVTIDKLKFDPPNISAHVGDPIEWASSDFVAHTATARNKDWDVAIPAKGFGRVTLDHPGEVDYFCRFHPNMTGQIVVAP